MAKAPDAGRLTCEVSIEQASFTQGTDGNLTATWSEYAAAWARIEPLSGAESWRGEQVAADVTHRITTHYVAGVTPKMRITYDGRTFDIVSVVNTDEAGAMLEISARENL